MYVKDYTRLIMVQKRKSHHIQSDSESFRNSLRKTEPPELIKEPVKESDKYGKSIIKENEEEKHSGPVEKPDYSVSGALARDLNTVQGVVLKYSEPVEARKPNQKYRLYVFKGSEQIETLHIHRQSSYLIGRERLVADIPVDHPSCSKQHAVIQYRLVSEKDTSGLEDKRCINPYILDLESSNGTFVNGIQIPSLRFYQLKLGDVIKFGHSTREYIFIKEEMV